METKKKGFIVHENYYEQVKLLSHEERGRLFLAMFEYHRNGALPEDFSPLLTMAFIGFRQAIDQDRIAYERRCETSRENGKKGGRPKKKNLSQPKKADMGMDMDMDMDIDMDMGMDMGMGMEKPSPSAPPQDVSDLSVSDGLSETEKEDLISFGLPTAYIEERLERARVYAKEQKKRVFDVLLLWWREDTKERRRKPPRASPKNPAKDPHDVQKSYDLDEFFEAALNRGLSGEL